MPEPGLEYITALWYYEITCDLCLGIATAFLFDVADSVVKRGLFIRSGMLAWFGASVEVYLWSGRHTWSWFPHCAISLVLPLFGEQRNIEVKVLKPAAASSSGACACARAVPYKLFRYLSCACCMFLGRHLGKSRVIRSPTSEPGVESPAPSRIAAALMSPAPPRSRRHRLYRQ